MLTNAVNYHSRMHLTVKC